MIKGKNKMKLITHTLEVKRHIIDLNEEGISLSEDILNLFRDGEIGVEDLPYEIEESSSMNISKETIENFMDNYPQGKKGETITLRNWILESFVLNGEEEIDLEPPCKYEIIGQDNGNRCIELTDEEKQMILKKGN